MSTYTIISNTNKALLTSFVTTLLAGAPKDVTPLVKPISNPAAGGGGGGGSAGYAI